MTVIIERKWLLKKDRKIIGNYNFTVGFATAGDYQG
jgi:hypothetical protein